MDAIQIQGYIPKGVTILSNHFIDQYMPEASGEFVKIYLYFLRLAASGESVTIADVIDRLDSTQMDIYRALNYWRKKGVVQCSFTREKELKSLTFLSPWNQESALQEETVLQTSQKISEVPAKQDSSTSDAQTKKASDKETVSTKLPPERIASLKHDPGIKQILFIAEQYLQHPLSSPEIEMLLYLYDACHFSVDLLDYLLDYCVSNHHKSWRYIQKVGLNWHKDGIDTVEKATERTQSYNKQRFAIMRAYGLNDRNPSPGESEMMERWINEFPLSFDLVLEAVTRTMDQIHKPQFAYTNRILEDWVKADVRSLKDVTAYDENYKKLQSQKNTQNKNTSSANSFHNFEGRKYDQSELAKKLVRL